MHVVRDTFSLVLRISALLAEYASDSRISTAAGEDLMESGSVWAGGKMDTDSFLSRCWTSWDVNGGDEWFLSGPVSSKDAVLLFPTTSMHEARDLSKVRRFAHCQFAG